MLKKLTILLLCLGAIQTLTADPTPAVPNFSPGPEYSDSVRMFQGIPGIERAANGRLWATWYGGGVTEDKDNYVLLYTSGDDGKSWQQVMVLDPDGAGPVRPFDPCLWLDPDGKLWLFWGQETTLQKGRDFGSFVTFAISTEDSGNANAKWSAPRQISRGVMMNKPIVTKDGRWLLPLASWYTDGSARVVVSGDHGATFSDLGAANIPDKKSRSAEEHMIVERKDGSLWMLVRGKFPPNVKDFTGLGESVSTDGGKTWTDVKASAIPHPVSRFFLRRLKSGNLLLVRHDPPNGGKDRSHLTAFLSGDDGATWKGGLMLDERYGVSYPDGVQAPDGSIDVIYDYQRWQDKEILMARFTEEDVLAGKLISPKSRLRIRINKATGIIPKSSAGTKVPDPGPVVADAEANPNTDGVPLMEGPAAEMEYSGDSETNTLEPGVALFLDRKYKLIEVPEALRGKQFICTKLEPVHMICRKPGVLYVITPSTGRDPFSREADLLNLGFQKVALPEFRLFGGIRCSVFQRQMAADEPLDFRQWGILVAPRKN